MSLTTRRNFGLDLVRSLAIGFVLLSHAKPLLQGTPLQGFPFIPLPDGVDVFFALSGFLIGGILLQLLDRKGGFSLSELGSFWKRRWWRTLPNYYLILGLQAALVTTGLVNGKTSDIHWSFLFFFQNLNSPLIGFFWESWSLAVEEWFYLLFPFLVLCIIRFKISWKGAYLWGAILMIAGAIAFRISSFNPELDPFWYDVTLRKIVLSRLDAIGFGLILAYFWFLKSTVLQVYKYALALVGLVLIIFSVCYNPPLDTVYSQVVFFSLVPMGVALMLPAMMSIPCPALFWRKGIEGFSKISYSLYLVNLGVVMALLQKYLEHQVLLGLWAYFIFWLGSISLSIVLYRYFEKPTTRLRERF